MARHRAIPAAIAHAVVATVVAAGEPATTFRLVADTSTPIPGGAGSFGFVFDPAIDGGNPVFWGRDVAGNDGIYSDLGSGLIRVADRTIPIPSGSGTFNFFGGDPMIKDGRVMLVGWGSGGQMGIYTYQSTLERAVDLSMAVPNGAGNFTFTGWPSLNGGILHFLGIGSTGRRRKLPPCGSRPPWSTIGLIRGCCASPTRSS